MLSRYIRSFQCGACPDTDHRSFLQITEISSFTIYLAVFTYLADCYGPFASSALAGQSLSRNLFGMAFPLFTAQMYDKLTYHWANTLFAFLALGMAPVPFVRVCVPRMLSLIVCTKPVLIFHFLLRYYFSKVPFYVREANSQKQSYTHDLPPSFLSQRHLTQDLHISSGLSRATTYQVINCLETPIMTPPATIYKRINASSPRSIISSYVGQYCFSPTRRSSLIQFTATIDCV